MGKYDKYFVCEGTSFHVLLMSESNSKNYIKELQEELPAKSYFTVIHIENIQQLDDLYKLFADAFHFPKYFGFNWDAFNECMNDLKWLKANSYVMVLGNLDQLKLDRHSVTVFVRILKEVATEWMKGRTFNPSFLTRPTPFHIIFASDKNSIDGLIVLLKSSGIKDIDIIK